MDNTSNVGAWVLGIIVVLLVIAAAWWAFSATGSPSVPNTGTQTSQPASGNSGGTSGTTY